MTNKPWKQFERDVGKLIRGKRYPANMGGGVDVESAELVVQCKNVKSLSFAALEKLAVEIAREGRESEKIGALVIKRRAGAGTPTKTLIIFTEDAWREFMRRTGNLVLGELDPTDTN